MTTTPIFDNLVDTDFPDVPRILNEPWSFESWKASFDADWEKGREKREQERQGYAELAKTAPKKRTGGKPRKTTEAPPARG
jgi:hypothetical protein